MARLSVKLGSPQVRPAHRETGDQLESVQPPGDDIETTQWQSAVSNNMVSLRWCQSGFSLTRPGSTRARTGTGRGRGRVLSGLSRVGGGGIFQPDIQLFLIPSASLEAPEIASSRRLCLYGIRELASATSLSLGLQLWPGLRCGKGALSPLLVESGQVEGCCNLSELLILHK